MASQKYRGGQLSPLPWSAISPNGNFSLINVSYAQLWQPLHPEYGRVNVDKRSDWVKSASDLNHFRLDNLYSDVRPDGLPWMAADGAEINYLFHYIDDAIVVFEQHFDRRQIGFDDYDDHHGEARAKKSISISDHHSTSPIAAQLTSPSTFPSIVRKRRFRYVLFANFGNETVTKDFADKFRFTITLLATDANRTSEFLTMRTLKLDPGEAMIVTVE